MDEKTNFKFFKFFAISQIFNDAMQNDSIYKRVGYGKDKSREKQLTSKERKHRKKRRRIANKSRHYNFNH